MVQFIMDLKIHFYVAISLERQPQKTHKKQKSKMSQSLIHDKQENLWQYVPILTMCNKQQILSMQNVLIDR